MLIGKDLELSAADLALRGELDDLLGNGKSNG
jgi:hypothetical protein